MTAYVTFVWWAWQRGYGDPLFWGIIAVYVGFLIHMMEDSKP